MKLGIHWLVGAALLLTACGDDSDGDGESAASVPIEDAPSALAGAFCAARLRCYPLEARSITAEQCTDIFEEAVRAGGFDRTIEAVDDGTATYDATPAAAGVDALKNRPGADLDAGELPECQETLQGTVPRGDECTLDAECAGDSICEFDGSCPGTCAARLSAGDLCGGEDGRCADGLVCSDATDRCAAPAEEGDPCGGGVEVQCKSPLICLGDDTNESRAGECVEQEAIFTAAVGDDCNFREGPLCESDLSCVLEDVDGAMLVATCREAAEENGDCGLAIPQQCPVGQYCAGLNVGLPLDLEGTCEDLPGEGEECGDSGLPNSARVCALGLTCVDGECRERRDNGQSCDADAECWSSNCDNGGCAPTASCE